MLAFRSKDDAMTVQTLVPRITSFSRVFFCAAWLGVAHAEPPLEVGATIEAQNNVILRASPPAQNFLFFVSKPGGEIYKIREGEKFTVKAVKEISVPFGKDVWVKGETKGGEVGWAYYGGKDKPVNFEGATTARE